MNLSQQLVNGVMLGMGYASIALGWTVLLGAARLVNFAHGQLYMLGAFVTFTALKLGVGYAPALAIAVVSVGLLGVVLQYGLRPLINRQDLARIMIATLGIGYVLEGIGSKIFGGNPQILETGLGTTLRFGPIWSTGQDLLLAASTLALYAVVWAVLHRTKLGSRIRAVAEDPMLAETFGIDPRTVYLLVFVFECAAVALAAGLIAPRTPILTSMGFDEAIMTFVVVVLGGIGSIGGALAASLGLGVFTAFFGALASPAYSTAAVFAVLLVVLVWRPEGLVRR